MGGDKPPCIGESPPAPEVLMSAMFEFLSGGIGVMPDPDDNPDGHIVPHHDAGLQISFEVVNVGKTAGIARVGVEVDGQFIMEWMSEQIEPNASMAGFVSLGRLAEGSHEILIFVNPGSGRNDHQTNNFELP
jgi:hypothetical protein